MGYAQEPLQSDSDLLLLATHPNPTLSQLLSLPTSELALISLSPTYDVLLRQRAYSTWAARKMSYRRSEMREPLFEIDLNDFPSDITQLSPGQLLVAQFSPIATQESVDACAALFFAKVKAAKVSAANGRETRSPTKSLARSENADRREEEERTLARFRLEKFRMDKEGGASLIETEGLSLCAKETVLLLKQDGEDLFEIEKESILHFTYIAGKIVESHGQECTLRIEVDAFKRFGKRHSDQNLVVAYFSLGPMETNDPPFVALRKLIKGWGSKGDKDGSDGFKIQLKESTPPPALRASSSTSSSPPRRHSIRSESTSSLSRKRSLHQSEDRESNHPREDDNGRRRRVSRCDENTTELNGYYNVGRTLSSPQVDRDSIWAYVGDVQVDIRWNPGFYLRQASLLFAFDPQSNLLMPEFSLEEFAILSWSPSTRLLPSLPMAATSTGNKRYVSEQRLAIERVYKHQCYTHVDSTRWLMSHEGREAFPALVRYVELIARVVTCRDIFKTAWASLVARLESRLGARSTRDPIESMLDVAKKLAFGPDNYRATLFGESGNELVARSKLSSDEIGIGPYRRFSEGLSKAVQFEAEALRQFAFAKAPGGVSRGGD